MTTARAELIGFHLELELASSLDPPIVVRLFTADEWAEQPLSPEEATAGWAHAQLAGEVCVLRFCPEIIDRHTAHLPRGERTSAKAGQAFTGGNLDGILRAIEHVVRYEILVWDPQMTQDLMIQTAHFAATSNNPYSSIVEEMLELTSKEASHG